MKRAAVAVVLLLSDRASGAGCQAARERRSGAGAVVPGAAQPGTGISCCSIADCRQTDYRAAGDHYEALVQGRWISVPPEKVLDRTDNPTGRGGGVLDAGHRHHVLRPRPGNLTRLPDLGCASARARPVPSGHRPGSANCPSE